MVIAQGVLGAVTVQYKLPWFVSTGHLLLGMSYFAILLWVAWRTRPARPGDDDAAAREARIRALGPARRWIAIATGVVLVQIILGGLMRHSEAALACLGMPDCTAGDWFPAAMTQRLHMIHRGWGVVVAVVTTLAAISVYRHAAGWTALRRMMMVAPIVVVTQIVLGIYVVLTFRAVPVAVAHFAGAAALWGLWISTWFVTRGARGAERNVLAPLRGVHAVP
jgi:heme A synthase